jgi:hypothetical protein
MKLKTCLTALMVVPAALAFSPLLKSQTSQPRQSGVDVHRDGWDRVVPEVPKDQPSSGPAPKRDLTGIWEPTPRYRDGVFATGPRNYPSDGKPEHELPFTPLGLKTWKSHKPGFGVTAVPIAENNDPFDICDPIGFPRLELFNLRAIQVWQNKDQVQIIYQNDQAWRNIWTDGRAMLKPDDVPEPRWYGYSVGHWTDDYTLVVDTTGLDERTWIDNVGRPHSDQLQVEETFHRVDNDILELTITIIDPKMYTKPWDAITKFRMRKQPEWFDVREQICSASEARDYNKTVAEEAAAEKAAAAKAKAAPAK